MSSIGMIETLAEHDEFFLVTIDGGAGGQILDCDGDKVLSIDAQFLEAAAKCLPVIVAAVQNGSESGERCGRIRQQYDMQKALGMDGLMHRLRKLECATFPGEHMA